jgi:ATP-dependent Clp protease adapter protein ClpS
LYNDETNFEFWVAEQLVKIVGLSEREALDTMKLAGISGQAKIGSYECLELAEYYHTALQAEGLAVKLLPIDLC